MDAAHKNAVRVDQSAHPALRRNLSNINTAMSNCANGNTFYSVPEHS